MRVRTLQLQQIIKEETFLVLTEHKMNQLFESAEMPEIVKVLQEALELTEAQARILKEGLMKTIKSWVNGVKKGVKWVMESIITFIDSYFVSWGATTSAKGAIGLILTQTEAGKAWVQKLINATANSEVWSGALPQVTEWADTLMAMPADQLTVTLLAGLVSVIGAFIWRKGWKKLGFEVRSGSTTDTAGLVGGTYQAVRTAVGV